MRPMTRARTASYGVVTPPPLQLWLHAVLMRFVSLVQGVATTLGMIFKRNHRDWHMEDAHEDLPQATSGIQRQDTTHTHGVILGLVPRISVGPSRGLSIDPLETENRDSRHKAENDSVVSQHPKPSPCHSGRTQSVRAGTQGLHAHRSQSARARARRE